MPGWDPAIPHACWARRGRAGFDRRRLTIAQEAQERIQRHVPRLDRTREVAAGVPRHVAAQDGGVTFLRPRMGHSAGAGWREP